MLALADESLDVVTVDDLRSDSDLDLTVDMPHQALKLPQVCFIETASELVDVLFLLK